MCRHGAPFRRTSSATRCGVMSSRRFPRCTGPDGLIPDAQVGTSPGCRRSPSSRTWAAVRATQSSAAATGSGLLRRSFAGISVQAIGMVTGSVIQRGLRLEAGLGPALEHLDPVGRPGAVAGHAAVLEVFEDLGGVRAVVVVRPQVERERHGLAVVL